MRKIISLIIIVCLCILPIDVNAAPMDFSGGVNNEYEYQEVIFLSGTPIKMVGKYTVSERERGDEKTYSYRFTLVAEDKSIEANLDRRAAYTTVYTRRNDKGQTTSQTTPGTVKETINIGEDRYILSDYHFSKSDVIDNRPASDYYSGTIKGRKVYDINRGEGRAIVEVSGGSTGYENFWGSTETQILDYLLDVNRQVEDGNENETRDVSWQGNFRVQVSDSINKSLSYTGNEASFSSFDGGHMRLTNQEMTSIYEYNMPWFIEGKPDYLRRDRGVIELSKKMLPHIERLIIPKFRDIGGHWAEDSIKILYSLDVFDEDNSTFFVPDVAMTRMEFTKALIRACNIRVEEEPKKSQRAARGVQEESPFMDVSVSHDDYKYLKEALNKGIISGVSRDRFMPDDSLTRSSAITIMIRTLGFEHKAPTPGYYTAFSDDYEIPYWAKDSIYVAREIGLVQGDAANRINANEVMTRAEASSMLLRLLHFLERDLQRDYREDIILFN